MEKKKTESSVTKTLTSLKQSDVPAYSLKDALRIAETLRDEYGKQATRPMMVASAMGVLPTTGPFRMLTGSSIAYELTEGAAQSSSISLTPLGRRAIAPTTEGDDRAAFREAVLKPRIVREFLEKYDGSKLPTNTIALNVLEELGVPKKAAQRAYNLIIENAEFVGFIVEVNGNKLINMTPTHSSSRIGEGRAIEKETENGELLEFLESKETDTFPKLVGIYPSLTSNPLATNKRVFISHGKNKDIVAQLREVLNYGGFEPVVSIDKEATATPVPDKVMDDMRSCGACIVNVGTDKIITDDDGVQHKWLNSNVLIEIGAALALYKRNFILLVEDGVELPSNLQGLYVVRYRGTSLDYEATIKLLKAFNEFKTNAGEEKPV